MVLETHATEAASTFSIHERIQSGLLSVFGVQLSDCGRSCDHGRVHSEYVCERMDISCSV